MKEKLLDLMKREGLKPSQLAEMLEINPAGVSHILAGRNKPGFDLLQKILRRFPRINPDWLLLDSDKMYRDESGATLRPATSIPASPTTPRVDDLFGATSTPHATMPHATSAGNQKSEAATSATISTQSSAISAIGKSNTATIGRVVIFYEDQTFESFTPTSR